MLITEAAEVSYIWINKYFHYDEITWEPSFKVNCIGVLSLQVQCWCFGVPLGAGA